MSGRAPRPVLLHPVTCPRTGKLILPMPSPRAIARHVIPSLLEGVVGPMAVFYLALVVLGFDGALYTALCWSCFALIRRILTHQRIPATLILGVVLLTARTVLAILTGSALLYFMQPTLGTLLVGLIFLVSAGARKPFIERLARDFCPFSPELLARAGMRRFFTHISLLWAIVMLSNAGIVLGLLVTTSLRAFVLERTLVSWTLSGLAIAGSVWAFRRAMHREGISLRLGAAEAA